MSTFILHKLFNYLAIISIALTVTTPVAADPRSDFLAAESALKRGDRSTFERLSAGLREYPLYPYLRFAALGNDVEALPEATITDFLAVDATSPLAARLRAVQLRRLAAAGRWTEYLQFDPLPLPTSASTDRRCLSLRALIATGRSAEALPHIPALWLVGRSQPAACDSVFQAWQQSGALTPQLVWQRIRLAMNAGESGLARSLGTLLPENERAWLAQWLAVEQTPTLINDANALAVDQPQRAAIVAHGITRMAATAPADAVQWLSRYRDWLATDPAAADRAYAAVGRALTRAGNAEGLRYWDGMRATSDTLAEQEQRARAALEFQDWDKLARWIAQMPDCAEKRDRWHYWQGRAEATLGLVASAQLSFAQAATARSFWGFMAADRIGKPYQLNHVATPAEPARIARLIRHPAWARLRELRQIGRETDVQREWRTLTQDLEAADLHAAAYIADVMRWHDRAIFTLARSGYWDDLALRFPLRYQDVVLTQAAQTGIAPEWIFGVIRQESVFAPAVVSRSGALGLMQLMPPTAAEVATRLGSAVPSPQELTDPAVNIVLGSAYLAQMWNAFQHAALATAAYNAGPGRVRQWLPAQPLDADLWIARIPFAETRGYVERVLAYRVIYAERLGRPPVRLAELLPPIPARK
ncbi:transglycosylase SLT domain-containing protein [Chromatium okenii]|uniref:transglycosylase SLT domain-containing protein n=1 Tax=Chromatium okenii TaxID=61644 RepID=UPI0030846411